jgi:predicted phage tail protein
MNTVYLHGHLADMFGPEWKFEVRTAAEAIRALNANCKGFLAYLTRNSEPGYHVVVGNADRSVEELHAGVGDQDIHVFPTFAGAKDSGWVNVILGAVLVVVGTAYGIQPLIGAGISMMLGGVSMLLTRPPSLISPKEDKYENTPSYLFNGPINTQAQGHPVPVGYGMLRVGGAVVSTSIVVEDFIPGTEDPNAFGFRITNLTNYLETFPEAPVAWSQQVHATGGTGPYTFAILSQSPGSYFTIEEDSGKYYLSTTTALFDSYEILLECTDTGDGDATVEKTIIVDIQYDGGPGSTPSEPTL